MVFALCTLSWGGISRRPRTRRSSPSSRPAEPSLAGTTPEEPQAWIATIARNECLSRLRRRRPETVPLLDDDAPANLDLSELVDQRAEITALSTAIAGLPSAQRQAVILRELYELSYREVKTRSASREPAVESLLFKAAKRLQD